EVAGGGEHVAERDEDEAAVAGAHEAAQPGAQELGGARRIAARERERGADARFDEVRRQLDGGGERLRGGVEIAGAQLLLGAGEVATSDGRAHQSTSSHEKRLAASSFLSSLLPSAAGVAFGVGGATGVFGGDGGGAACDDGCGFGGGIGCGGGIAGVAVAAGAVVVAAAGADDC